MTGLRRRAYTPAPAAHRVYRKLYALYKQLHDAFGTREWEGKLFNVMKDLIAIRGRMRR